MTEPFLYNVDPRESDASTKFEKGRNVEDAGKEFKSKTYDSENPKKFLDVKLRHYSGDRGKGF